MTIKEAKVLIDVLRNEVQTEEYCLASDKQKLDNYKPLFEDGTATEKDRKEAQYLEDSIRNRHFKMETLFCAINTIENREFTISL